MTPQEHLEYARDYALNGFIRYASKAFTGIEVNGVEFSNIQEMLVYMDKQKNEIESLKNQIEKLKCCRNCKKLDNRKVECSEGSDLIYFLLKNCDKWEIKEK